MIPGSITKITQGTAEIVITTEQPLKTHEVDMIVGMDAMINIPRPRNWTVEQTPFMYLPKDIILGRLLAEWTTLDAKQIAETTEVLSVAEGALDLESDSDSDAVSSTFSDHDAATTKIAQQSSSQQNPNENLRQGLTGFSSEKDLAGKIERMRASGVISTGYERKTQSNSMPDVRLRKDMRPDSPPLAHVPLLVQSSPTLSSQDHRPLDHSIVIQHPRPLDTPPQTPPFLPQDKNGLPDEPFRLDSGINNISHTSEVCRGSAIISDETSSIPHMDLNDDEGKAYAERLETAKQRYKTNHAPDHAPDQSLIHNQLENQVGYAALRERFKTDFRQMLDEQQRVLENLQETYEKKLERTCADVERRNADQRQILEAIKDQVIIEHRSEQKPARQKVTDSGESQRLFGEEGEWDPEQADPEEQDTRPETEHFVRQFMDRVPRPRNDVAEASRLSDTFHSFTVPWHTEFDIMSYKTEASTSSASSKAGGPCSDDQDSDETETDSIIADDQQSGGEPRNIDIERSQPWKGPAYLGKFMGLTPLYLRGSDAGQTWYRGADPVYMIEFTESYNGEISHAPTCTGQYLLISKFWVDVEALDRFGFQYAACPSSYFYLDPSLSWESVEALVSFTFYLREVDTFRTFGQLKGPSLAGGMPPPPRSDFTKHDKFSNSLTSSDEETTSDAVQKESNPEYSDGHAPGDEQWTFRNGLLYSFNVLKFALRMIC